MNDYESDSERFAGGLTREMLENDAMRRALRARHPEVPVLDDAALQASIDDTLARRPAQARAQGGIWLFAYGSLLWNPCIRVAERRLGRLYGFHRDFCLKLIFGRGSPDAPGLMLALAPGGSCQGVALRVAERDLDSELLLVWRREMLTGVYRPRWLRLYSAHGALDVVGFVVNRDHERYTGRLDERELVRLMATGHGVLGSCAEYLNNTVAHLDELGIRDRRLHRLRQRVHDRRA